MLSSSRTSSARYVVLIALRHSCRPSVSVGSRIERADLALRAQVQGRWTFEVNSRTVSFCSQRLPYTFCYGLRQESPLNSGFGRCLLTDDPWSKPQALRAQFAPNGEEVHGNRFGGNRQLIGDFLLRMASNMQLHHLLLGTAKTLVPLRDLVLEGRHSVRRGITTLAQPARASAPAGASLPAWPAPAAPAHAPI
jgi:hypothetical protein